ncbi:hypothetical protein M378DRAFT_162451, partial [Amanita muscaria Koide BX008]
MMTSLDIERLNGTFRPAVSAQAGSSIRSISIPILFSYKKHNRCHNNDKKHSAQLSPLRLTHIQNSTRRMINRTSPPPKSESHGSEFLCRMQSY